MVGPVILALSCMTSSPYEPSDTSRLALAKFVQPGQCRHLDGPRV